MGRIYINSSLDFDDCSQAYSMILAGKLNMLKNVLSFKKMLFYFLLILFHGCFLVEDFNNFRLSGSPASHANTKLSAAKYRA